MRGLSVLVVALALLVGSASAGPHHLWERQPSGQTAYDFISGAGTSIEHRAPQLRGAGGYRARSARIDA